MSLSGRLGKLEREAEAPPTRRCETCEGWRARLVVVNDWQDPPREPTLPECCPDCGREVPSIAVEYVEDWRPGGEPA